MPVSPPAPTTFDTLVNNPYTPPAMSHTSRSYLNAAERRDAILSAAVAVAREKGLAGMTRQAVADAACVAPGLVSHYFATMANLEDRVIRQAIAEKVLEVLADALAKRHPSAQLAPLRLRQQALSTLSK